MKNFLTFTEFLNKMGCEMPPSCILSLTDDRKNLLLLVPTKPERADLVQEESSKPQDLEVSTYVLRELRGPTRSVWSWNSFNTSKILCAKHLPGGSEPSLVDLTNLPVRPLRALLPGSLLEAFDHLQAQS